MDETLRAALAAAVEGAIVPAADGTARFAAIVPDDRDPDAVRAEMAAVLQPAGISVIPLTPLAPRDLAVVLPGRAFADPALAFEAAHRLEAAFDLLAAEPDLPHGVMPTHPVEQPGDTVEEGFEGFPPGCWVAAEPDLENRKDWALRTLRVRQAWAFSERRGRPSRGQGVVIAQPDTGVTDHVELRGVDRAGGFNLIDTGRPEDPTDPLGYEGNPGHGTATGSVVVSPETGIVVGSAPRARHMPIRAINSVVRLSQVTVAQAIDQAVDAGAHVITLSLGGIYSIALERALHRAVAANAVVLAAAGNCVGLVVWPARFDACIAVAGIDAADGPWRGSCRGPDVDISAPAQNVYRAAIGTTPAGQGQGTSFAVALTAGIVACWLAHHGRAQVITEARRRGESVQAMVSRLLRATARRPGPDWDEVNFGAGIVDAAALLKADFDLGRDTEGPQFAGMPVRDGSVAGLMLEALGTPPPPDVDLKRLGPELSYAVLQARATGIDAALEGGLTEEAAAGWAASLSATARATLGLGALPAPPVRPTPAPSVPSPAERALAQRRILAGRFAREERSGLESAEAVEESSLPPDAPMPRPDDILHRVDEVMRALPPGEIDDPAAFAWSLEALYRFGEPALRKVIDLRPAMGPGLSTDEVSALEAVVIADGSRPSFLLRDGELPREHPFFGVWKEDIDAARTVVKQAAQAVGRVQPRGGHASLFLGTATLVDRDQLLALTNFHVLDDARAKLGIPLSTHGDRLLVGPGLEVEFVGEADILATNRFRVSSARLPANAGRGFGRLDAALLQLEPVDARSQAPEALRLTGTVDFVQGDTSRLPSLCAIGFPGRPPISGDTTGEIDWSFVISTLFGNRFGFKRLAPGKFTLSVGSDPRDEPRFVFGHDATTFGGSSGTSLLAWRSEDAKAFGLHFAGTTSKTNHAIAFAGAAEALRKIGVPFH